MAALLGMLTGIGGGMTRDVLLAEIPMLLAEIPMLLAEIPTVLRADLTPLPPWPARPWL